jgi:hypothetical protein
VVVEEGQPPLAWFRISRSSLHPTRDGSFRNIAAEHEQLTVYAGRCPTRVLRHHSGNQLQDLLRSRPLPIGFLTFEITLQYRRKPARRQRTTVSGVTPMSDCFHFDRNRRTAIQTSLSKLLRLGRRRRRFSTASCCRRTNFSKARSRWLRKRRKSAPNQSKNKLSMAGVITERRRMAVATLLISKWARVLARDRARPGPSPQSQIEISKSPDRARGLRFEVAGMVSQMIERRDFEC